MFLSQLFLFGIFLRSVALRCAITRITSQLSRSNPKHCVIDPSKTGVGVGPVRNLTEKCRYDHTKQNFLYTLSWLPPVTTEAAVVSKYLVRIRYGQQHRICFKLSASQTTFIFNQSIGLLHGCRFHISVTALPVVYKDRSVHQKTLQVLCPMPTKLLPLPNIMVKPGSTYSFLARFLHEPIQNITINWFFSPDIIFCRKNRTRITAERHRDIVTSSEGRILTIRNISNDHVGCYVTKVGSADEVRGYLNINSTLVSVIAPHNNTIATFEKLFFAILAVLMVIIVVYLAVIFLKRRMASMKQDSDVCTTLLKKAVYLCHSTDEAKERSELMYFIDILKRSGIDVIIDILSSPSEMNRLGGLSRWIPEKMNNAHRVIIFLTPKYVQAMRSTSEIPVDSAIEERIRKNHAELNFMSNLPYIQLDDQNHRVIVASMKVKRSELPYIIHGAKWVMFQKSIRSCKESDFRLMIKEILDD